MCQVLHRLALPARSREAQVAHHLFSSESSPRDTGKVACQGRDLLFNTASLWDLALAGTAAKVEGSARCLPARPPAAGGVAEGRGSAVLLCCLGSSGPSTT